MDLSIIYILGMALLFGVVGLLFTPAKIKRPTVKIEPRLGDYKTLTRHQDEYHWMKEFENMGEPTLTRKDGKLSVSGVQKQ